jgi:hypothetical protein
MADKKEHKSYRDIELNTQKVTLAKSIDREMRLRNLRDDMTRYGHIDGFSQKRSYKEECSIDEPQGPQMG